MRKLGDTEVAGDMTVILTTESSSPSLTPQQKLDSFLEKRWL
jgi:hypothetical protein